MKVGLLIVLLTISTGVAGQDNVIHSLDSRFPSGFSDFVSSVKALNKPTDIALLKSLSHNAHRSYLKKYSAYAHVDDIFSKGSYDCLSGTYFFSAALDQLGFRYRIIETNYHIFLMVRTSGGEVLLESTDRENGVVTDPKIIEEKLLSYRSSSNEATNLYLSGVDLFGELTPAQLPGLIYFNKAVEAFKAKQLLDCCALLERAWKVYDNPRIGHFVPVLLKSVLGSSIPQEDKDRLTSVLKSYHGVGWQAIAAR